jgi:hypothetical protein
MHLANLASPIGATANAIADRGSAALVIKPWFISHIQIDRVGAPWNSSHHLSPFQAIPHFLKSNRWSVGLTKRIGMAIMRQSAVADVRTILCHAREVALRSCPRSDPRSPKPKTPFDQASRDQIVKLVCSGCKPSLSFHLASTSVGSSQQPWGGQIERLDAADGSIPPVHVMGKQSGARRYLAPGRPTSAVPRTAANRTSPGSRAEQPLR